MKYNLVNFCEFDKYAVKSYCAIHGVDENKNLGDITKVEKLPKCDFLTYGFPCQDISIAGLQAGIKQGTRSGLLFEVERLLEQSEYKPKFLLMENVKNLVGKNHKASFELWLNKLEELGYKNYWQALNSKNYGIPQNRERVFCLSVRKDIDNGFEFPQKQGLKLYLGDIIEDVVDEKFYLSDVALKGISSSKFVQKQKQIKDKSGIASTCLSRDYKDPQCIRIGSINLGNNESNNRVYSTNGISPTLNTCEGGHRQAKILDRTKSEKFGGNKIYNSYSPCIRAARHGLEAVIDEKVRKLTPLEYYRLQGFDDKSFYKAQKVNSNSQLYKQAGNSITVDVLVAIYNQIKAFYPNDFKDGIDVVTLFSGIGAFEKAFDKI